MEDQSSDPQGNAGTIEPNRDERAQMLIRSVIEFIGEDPKREGLRDTPRRVIKSFSEIYGGYAMDPKKILATTFEKNGYDQMVVLKNIELYSTCEHHMIPFFGRASVGYVPGAKVVGLSKLARLVDCFSRRLQIQENLTQQIADSMNDILQPKGVMVVISAKHLCMCARGVEKQHSEMVTSAIKGCFSETGPRAEFMNLIKE